MKTNGPTKLALIPILLSSMIIGCSGKRPLIGVEQGQLSPCPKSPNCVSSMAPANDKSHFIKPISYYPSDKRKALETLRRVLMLQARINIVDASEAYLHVEFKSKIFRFVDDVEFFFIDNEPLIHIRSASRLGYSDLGANRKRMELIRSQFAADLKNNQQMESPIESKS